MKKSTIRFVPSQEPASEPRPESLDVLRIALQNLDFSESNRQTHSRSKPEHLASKTYGPQKSETKNYRAGKKMSSDPKVAPSRSSGGVPSATSLYLAGAAVQPVRLQGPQHLLVVIDLNGTILYRPSRSNPSKYIARPHALRFLQYCIDTFNVVIWSSARPENVDKLVTSILPPPLLSGCVAIWGRDKFGLSESDYSKHVQCYKRLTKLWTDSTIASSHPEFRFGGRWDQTNTVLVDDSAEKGKSEPYNILQIPEYLGDKLERENILPQVHDYLNQLSLHSNVSAYMKAAPFAALGASNGPPGHREL